MITSQITNEWTAERHTLRPQSARDVRQRFTLDGDDQLEHQLADTCAKVLAHVREIVPQKRLEAVALGGGYGRGEGGVLKTGGTDQPYNDLEFYIFVRGNRFWNEHVYGRKLVETGERLSPEAGLHVEFKVESLNHFSGSQVTMYSYDLVSGHHILAGEPTVFRGCARHLNARNIPLGEATRLLMNRCTGLLMAREKLQKPDISGADIDFIQRNIAKARLALGDALLTALGEYHWSCRERLRRLQHRMKHPPSGWPGKVCGHHAAGVAFKLHPDKPALKRMVAESQIKEVIALALEVWLWLESRRLACRFESARQYGLSTLNKWPDTSVWRNCLINMRSFGPSAFFKTNWHRHPRETALSILALLLWETDNQDTEVQRQITDKIRLPFKKSAGLTGAYKELWSKVN